MFLFFQVYMKIATGGLRYVLILRNTFVVLNCII